MTISTRTCRLVAMSLLVVAVGPSLAAEVPRGHPRLLGDRDRLQKLAQRRRDDYRRVVQIARNPSADEGPRMISIGLVCAIEEDEEYGREAVELALKYVGGPIRKGHVPFGHDLALCALVYDLCHEAWRPGERKAFHDYVNATVDANADSETHVFHNGWYGYKSWGIGVASYATYHENPRAPEIVAALDRDYSSRAAPALRLAGDGGGWAEGSHYVVTNGRGRLFVQTLLPEAPGVRLARGGDLYRYGGRSYPPSRSTGPAPACRMEVRPSRPATFDVFLHVLTATDSSVARPPQASASGMDGEVRVRVGEAELRFLTESLDGSIEIDGARKAFPKPRGR